MKRKHFMGLGHLGWLFMLTVLCFPNDQLLGQNMDMFGKTLNSDLCNRIMSFDSDTEVDRLVSIIMKVQGLSNPYKIGSCNLVENAVAINQDCEPVILYNPEFLKQVKQYSFSSTNIPTTSEDWGVLLVLAHEIGHHQNFHLTSKDARLNAHVKELEADKFAGRILYLLNAPDLFTAQSVLRGPKISDEDSYTHPPRLQRLEAFKEGWNKAKDKYPRQGTIQALNCNEAMWTGKLTVGENVTELRSIVPYTGSNEGTYVEQVAISSGVRGLKLSLASGRFEEDSGTLEYVVSGRPQQIGSALFELNIGGQRCALSVEVQEYKVPEFVDDPLVGKFIFVQGGSFVMGCTGEQKDCDGDELPPHRVTLSDYYIGETEVTQAQWRAVMGEGSIINKGCDQCPIESVSWNSVQVFINKLNTMSTGMYYRLPTEAEWEYAARGGKRSMGYLYSGSNDLDDVAWYNGNPEDRTQPVRQLQPNELGLYDMSGNVWEWCADWYDNYPSVDQINPTGPDRRTTRVIRGGAWYGEDADCRVSFRDDEKPDNSFNVLGFRLVGVYSATK
jgi:hypothetical protein